MLSARQKKKLRRLIILSVSVLLLALSVWLFYQQMGYRKAKYTRYPEFGIAIPGGYAIHGIDVSKYQSTIAWEEVKKMKVSHIQIGFAFIKATQNTDKTDPHFKRNWKKSKEAGLYRGAYHFFIASRDGRQQAANFMETVQLEKGDMPPVLDVEQTNGVSDEHLRTEVKKWLEMVETHYGVRPIIYTNVDFYNRHLGSEFDDYPLWAAHYYQPEQPRIKRGWVFWQHSDVGQVNGIVSKVDFNVFNGDSTDFKKMLID